MTSCQVEASVRFVQAGAANRYNPQNGDFEQDPVILIDDWRVYRIIMKCYLSDDNSIDNDDWFMDLEGSPFSDKPTYFRRSLTWPWGNVLFVPCQDVGQSGQPAVLMSNFSAKKWRPPCSSRKTRNMWSHHSCHAASRCPRRRVLWWTDPWAPGTNRSQYEFPQGWLCYLCWFLFF